MERLTKSQLVLGNSYEVLKEYESDQVHLIWTSPPYFSQRPEYAEYESLQEYLSQMAEIFIQCTRVLRHGHVFAVNIGQDRSVDLPAHISMILHDLGLKYIDTIEWNKGGEIGMRGQFIERGKYYPNFAHEPILIYQKPPLVSVGGQSLSKDDFPEFEMSDLPFIGSALRSNVWNVQPVKSSWHPAPFPVDLAKNVVRCYTKRGQYVLDPFGGSGTTAKACIELGRDYFLIERSEEYYDKAKQELSSVNIGLGL